MIAIPRQAWSRGACAKKAPPAGKNAWRREFEHKGSIPSLLGGSAHKCQLFSATAVPVAVRIP